MRHVVVVGVPGLDPGGAQRLDQPQAVGAQDVVATGDDGGGRQPAQVGAEPFVSVNIGCGSGEEAADWLEYMTASQPTALAKARAANGHSRDDSEVSVNG